MYIVCGLIGLAIGFGLGVAAAVKWPGFANREIARALRAEADAKILAQNAELKLARLESRILDKAKAVEGAAKKL